MAARTPFLSIVVPAYNEERRLPHSLEQIHAFLQTQPYQAEVLIVENGSTDGTWQVIQTFVARYPGQMRGLRSPRKGKGLAVRLGMLAARGRYRFLADADLSMPITELPRFLPPRLPAFDIAIATREGPGAVRYGEPWHRHVMGRAFNLLVRALALPGLHDSQCGFKMFRGPVAEDVFRHARLEGMAFDVEVLFIARRRGYRIVEVPIPWYFDPDSRVHPIRDTLHMLRDLVRIRWNARQGVYDRPKEDRP